YLAHRALPSFPTRRSSDLELRRMELVQGSNRLRVVDVSKQLDPHSVLLRWQGEGAGMPQLVAHSYDLGVASGEGLLKRYLGRERSEEHTSELQSPYDLVCR